MILLIYIPPFLANESSIPLGRQFKSLLVSQQICLLATHEAISAILGATSGSIGIIDGAGRDKIFILTNKNRE
jgi:hypothetical protein